MLLEITTTHTPATDLGFLMAKHPNRVQRFTLAFGDAVVYYPEASAERCTLALLLEVDPVALSRGKEGAAGIYPYINDRAYCAASFMSVALTRVLRSAMAGSSEGRPQLVDTPLPLAIHLPVLRVRGGVEILAAWFEPLGYAIEATPLSDDSGYGEVAGPSHVALRLTATLPLKDALSHLYVLLPAIDGDKHYFIGADEVDKLIAKGGAWLGAHPERDRIVSRYLRHRRTLVRDALARLLDTDDEAVEEREEQREAAEERLEKPLSLNDQRLGSVMSVLASLGATSVVDLGCGEGRLLARLLDDRRYERLLGVDVSNRALDIAHDRLRLDRLPELKRKRIELRQGALTYRDAGLAGFDAACAVEVIEHLDATRLGAFERVVFECARPGAVIVTTPNAEYNVLFDALPAGRFRHADHRFEWTRAEFEDWARGVATRRGYQVSFLPIGDLDPVHGAPTQMGVFRRD